MFSAKMGFYYKAILGQPDYWVAVFNDFTPTDIAVNSVTAGQDYSFISGYTGTAGATQRGALYKLDQKGNITFQEQMNQQSTLRNVITDNNEVAVVGGLTYETGSSLPYIAKYNSSGVLSWEKYGSISYIIIALDFQQLTSGQNTVLAVGTGGKQIAYNYDDGSISYQKSYSNIGQFNDTSTTQNGSNYPSFSVAMDTSGSGPAYDVLTVLGVNRDGNAWQRRIVGNTGLVLSNPFGLYRAFRFQASAINVSTNKPVIILFNTDAGNTNPPINYNSNTILDGTVVGGLRYARNNESGFYTAATQTNYTIWSGSIPDDLGEPTQQTNFYFGTAGTNVTDLGSYAVSNDNGYSAPARYILGTTNYYGTTKGFIARLPKAGTIPGSGTYGASGEIHYATSSYMNTGGSLTLTSGTKTIGATTTTDTVTTSSQTMSATTNTYTLNPVS